MIDHGLDLALIGNGRTAALVDPQSRIVWWCFPGFDGDPIFCRLLAGGEGPGTGRRVGHDFLPFLVRDLSARETAPRWMVLAPRRGRRPDPPHRLHSPNRLRLLPLFLPVPEHLPHGRHGHTYSEPA